MVYVMLTSLVLSIFLDCVLFYHSFQVKSIHIYFDRGFFKENVRYSVWTYSRGDEHAARKRTSCGPQSIQAIPAVLNFL